MWPEQRRPRGGGESALEQSLLKHSVVKLKVKVKSSQVKSGVGKSAQEQWVKLKVKVKSSRNKIYLDLVS